MATERLSDTAGTTVAAMIKNVIWRLLKDRPYTDTHTNDPPNPATSLTVISDATKRYRVGTLIEWLDDGSNDIALVTATAASTLTVSAGQLGSTAADHAANARFRVEPRFYGVDAEKAINDAILTDLYPDLFAVYSETLTPDANTRYYTLTANAEDVLRVYQKTDSTTPQELSFVWAEHPEYVDSTLATSKKALYLPSLADENNTIFVQWTRKPAVGDLSDAMVRIVEYLAAARLLEQDSAGRGIDEALKASGAVVPGGPRSDALHFRRMAAEMKRTERAMLNRRWPRRKKNFILARHDY